MEFFKNVSAIVAIICLVCLIAFFCNFLEQINFYGLSSSTSEIINKPLTNVDIKQKIVALPEYQGDSLIITADGKIESKDGLIQSYIHHSGGYTMVDHLITPII